MALFTLKNVNFKNIILYPDLDIQGSGTIFICGESGTGKSTLLKLLNDVISPESGEIYYNGTALSEYESLTLRREVLLVSQSAFLFDGMTISENFTEYYNYLELPPPDEKTVQSFLSLCCGEGLDHAQNCNVFSGGERQRVFLAINLSLPTYKVIMFDEPTSALDSQTANTVMANIKDYCHKNAKQLIVISHDKMIVQKFADEVIML
ncbi:MAG: ATP-binding cassette domain-containing protein [Oscillospiraceae bacterium]|nr:ATP-binding cassette domain-containing protein [Oscillospiraceae bacterium]